MFTWWSKCRHPPHHLKNLSLSGPSVLQPAHCTWDEQNQNLQFNNKSYHLNSLVQKSCVLGPEVVPPHTQVPVAPHQMLEPDQSEVSMRSRDQLPRADWCSHLALAASCFSAFSSISLSTVMQRSSNASLAASLLSSMTSMADWTSSSPILKHFNII